MLSAVEPIAGTRGSLAAYFDVSLELLRTIANVLDIRPVLPQVSEIVNKMLPHDSLALACLERDGQVGLEAATANLPAVQPLVFSTPVPEDFIIGDLTSEPLPVLRGIDPTPVFHIHIPPLRERRADILPLSEAFLQELGRSFARPLAGLTGEARETLLQYDWPGNVRELRNALERAAILCEDALITPQHLSLESTVKLSRSSDTTDLGTMERETIAKVLRDCRWNKSDAARRLGLSRTQLYIRMRRYHVEEAARPEAAGPGRHVTASPRLRHGTPPQPGGHLSRPTATSVMSSADSSPALQVSTASRMRGNSCATSPRVAVHRSISRGRPNSSSWRSRASITPSVYMSSVPSAGTVTVPTS
jgi:Bacterial regulatory protein, Fis family